MGKNAINLMQENLPVWENIIIQLNAWELILRDKGLKDVTATRKVQDIGLFFLYIQEQRTIKKIINWDNMQDVVFEYVRDGYFNSDNLENLGTVGYRRSIYNNIKDGFNYVYRDTKHTLLRELSQEEIDLLESISKNRWFRFSGTRNTEDINESIQLQLIEKLGIKVYFDEDNKPYVLSHELAELVNKNNKDVMKSLRQIVDRFARAKNFALAENVDISMVQDDYTYNTNNGGTSQVVTYRLSKDLVMHYVLGLTGEKYSIFKFEYQAAFNFIEEEYNKLIKKHTEIKEAFYKMYNDVLKRNRELFMEIRELKLKKK